MNSVHFSLLSAKLAAGVALTATAVMWSLHYFLGLSLGSPVALGILSGAVAYGWNHLLLHDRIKTASKTLRQLRHHQFENLRPPAKMEGDELDELLREVFQAGRTVEKEFGELRKMENYRREFLGNVSHELKTPIFTIQGFTETLLSGALEDQKVNRQFLNKIARNTERLEELTEDLSAIARLEMEDLENSFEPFDLFELTREVTESLELRAREKEIDLHQSVSPHLPNVVGHREHLRQLLSNLLDNGIKYNTAGGQVRLRAELQSDGDIKIAVTDDGIGIAEEEMPRLTERFYRVDKSRSREQGGTGLGLAIVKHILQAHGRRLHIESQPGEGSEFWFSLPTV